MKVEICCETEIVKLKSTFFKVFVPGKRKLSACTHIPVSGKCQGNISMQKNAM
jgi:hypothetical protein